MPEPCLNEDMETHTTTRLTRSDVVLARTGDTITVVTRTGRTPIGTIIRTTECVGPRQYRPVYIAKTSADGQVITRAAQQHLAVAAVISRHNYTEA